MILRRRIGTLFAVLIAALVSCATPVITASEMEVATLDRGIYSGVKDSACLVVQDDEQLFGLWRRIYLTRSIEPPVPDVDFARETVLAGFQGEQPSGGYGITVARVTEGPSGTLVEVSRSVPGVDAMVTMAITSPYHLVVIPRPKLPIQFAGCP